MRYKVLSMELAPSKFPSIYPALAELEKEASYLYSLTNTQAQNTLSPQKPAESGTSVEDVNRLTSALI